MKKIIIFSFALLTLACSKEEVKPDCQTKSFGYIKFLNSNSDPYNCYIDNIYNGIIPASSSNTFQVNSGSIVFKLEQKSGYIFVPTVYSNSTTISNCNTTNIMLDR